MRKIIPIFLFLFSSVLLGSDAFVSVNGGLGSPGSENNIISVSLTNSVPVKGIQFKITDIPNYLIPDTILVSSRTEGFSINFNELEEDNSLIVIMISFNKLIPVGSGTIMDIYYRVSSSAEPNQTLQLVIDELKVTGEENNYLDAESSNSKFKISSITVVEDDDIIPENFKLCQNYPNPFNPTTRISFSIPESNFVKLEIFNSLGQKVRTLLNGKMNRGQHVVQWDGINDYGNFVPAGTYFYRINAGEFTDTKRLSLIK